MIFLWFAGGIAIGVILAVVIFSITPKKREKRIHTFDEESISELIGKIQHVTSVNVDTVEKKITELKNTIRQANIAYMKLNEAISDAKNVSTSIPNVEKAKDFKRNSIPPTTVSKSSDEKKAKEFGEERAKIARIMESLNKDELSDDENSGILKMKKNVERLSTSVRVLTREEKIMDLKARGWSTEKIAESLSMGVGEVSLVIEMNSHISKSGGSKDDEEGI
jgi:hypothetical protein